MKKVERYFIINWAPLRQIPTDRLTYWRLLQCFILGMSQPGGQRHTELGLIPQITFPWFNTPVNNLSLRRQSGHQNLRIFFSQWHELRYIYIVSKCLASLKWCNMRFLASQITGKFPVRSTDSLWENSKALRYLRFLKTSDVKNILLL